jgi:hypothetical protein
MAEVTTDPAAEEVTDDDTQEEVDEETQDETDESSEDATTDEDDEETDDESDDSDDEASDEEDFTKRFTQFKGDTPTEYLKNLEDGYAESSKEAVKLSRENKDLKATVERVNQLIANNPELAQAVSDGKQAPAAPKDPAILFAETQMKQTWQKEYNDFAREHPEIDTDPALADALDAKLKIAKRIVEEEEGRLVGMGEGLNMAWKLLGKDTDDKQERVRVASKDSASQGKASGSKKKDARPKFSEAQIEVHMEMAGVDRNTAIKQLSEHVK